MGKKQQKKDVEAVLIRVMHEFKAKSKKCETRLWGNRERELSGVDTNQRKMKGSHTHIKVLEKYE